jgi:cation diffusion facilitator family transporter
MRFDDHLFFLGHRSVQALYGRIINLVRVIWWRGCVRATKVNFEEAEKEKKRVALSSVIAAVFLTIVKIIVGLLTNSLGILSEAAHSGLDLVAAGVTYFAVRVSDKPPDRAHQYGHGKIENLSALFETLLLLATCGWIIYEAITRLMDPEYVEATLWSFLVMVISIVVDISRSRALMKTAKKYQSQALEADALHFSTDIWSSFVVILGLIAVWSAQWIEANTQYQAPWLYQADAVAALGVSGIVIWVSIQMGRRTISVLLDTAESDVAEKIESVVNGVPGVLRVQRVRVRHSGPETFVDVVIEVPRNLSLEEANKTVVKVNRVIEKAVVNSDVVVHLAPSVKDEDSLVEEIQSTAARHGLGVHGVRAYDDAGNISLEMHLELPATMVLGEAHARVDVFEQELYQTLPEVINIATHIEPVGDDDMYRTATRASLETIKKVVDELPHQVDHVEDCHDLIVFHDGSELSVSFHCLIDPEVSVSEAHSCTVNLENLLRDKVPGLGRVVIHSEPVPREQER